MEELNEKDLRVNTAMKWGLIAGSLYIVNLFINYFISTAYVFQPWMFFISLAITLVTLGTSSFQFRQKLGGYVSFGSVYGLLMIQTLIAALICLLGEYVLFNLIDTSLINLEKQLSIERSIEFMKSFNTPESKMELAIEQLEASNLRSVGNYLINYVKIVIGWGLLSLIIAAIVKRTPKNP